MYYMKIFESFHFLEPEHGDSVDVIYLKYLENSAVTYFSSPGFRGAGGHSNLDCRK